MPDLKLFRDGTGGWVTRDGLRRALDCARAPDADVLYVHTSLTFGRPNPDIRRAELLMQVGEVLLGLGAPTICLPTYTFSFCNGEPYDVARSRSRMGALNEHMRLRPGSVRSRDPLLSVAMLGRGLDLVRDLGTESLGADSTFARLNGRPGVRFLFVGVSLGDCFTYMHHLEWAARVPYRYDREFRGRITEDGVTREESWKLFVRFASVRPSRGSHAYEETLRRRGLLHEAPLGDGRVSSVSEADAREVFFEILKGAPNAFIAEPFDPERADPRFEARDMVSL